jgi:low temperature requirement protein LtrA
VSNAQEWTLLRPPRLRTLDDEEEGHASWLELFFDVAFETWVYHRAQVARPA